MVKKLAMPDGRMRLHADSTSAFIGTWEWEPVPRSVFARLKAARDSVVDIAPGLRSRKQALAQDGTLTEAGVVKAMLGDVPNAVRSLRKAERVVARERAEVAKRRAAMALKPPDKSDIAGELARQEIRAWVRGLSQKDRDAYFGRDNVPPVIAEAVMMAPRELTGVAASHYDLLTSRAIEAQYPGESEELAETEAAIGKVELAIAANQAGLVEEIGLNHRAEIERLSEPAVRGVDAAAEAEEETPPPAPTADALFGAVDSLPWSERSKLIDRALAEERAA